MLNNPPINKVSPSFNCTVVFIVLSFNMISDADVIFEIDPELDEISSMIEPSPRITGVTFKLMPTSRLEIV